MFRILLSLVAVCSLSVSALAAEGLRKTSGASQDGRQAIRIALSPQTIAVPAVASSVTTAASEAAPGGPILKILQRRRAGITAANIIRTLKAMKAEGSLDQYKQINPETGAVEISISPLAVDIAGRLAAENPQAWEDIDWDQVLDFIEKLLKILMEYLPIIIDLFTVNVEAGAIMFAQTPTGLLPVFFLAA